MDELRLSLLALFVAVIAGIYLFDTLRRRGAARPQAQPPETSSDAGRTRDAKAADADAQVRDTGPAMPDSAPGPPRAGEADSDETYADETYAGKTHTGEPALHQTSPDGAYPDAVGPAGSEIREPRAEDSRDIPLGDIDLLRCDASDGLDRVRGEEASALPDMLEGRDEQLFDEARLLGQAHEDAPFEQGQLDLDGPSNRREPRFDGSVAGPRSDELIVVLHIMRSNRSQMPGHMVQAALGTAQLELGEMSIYHHYGLTYSGAHQPVFSVARAVEPGTFDAQDESTYATPGLTLFMRLPGPQDGAVVLELMFNTAQTLARDLDASVLDERRTPLSAQALNHLRDKVAEFARRQKLVAS